MRIVNFNKIGKEGKDFEIAIKDIIGRVWGVPKAMIILSPYKTEWDTNRITFGYWIPNRNRPVALQDKEGRLIVLNKEEYEEYYEELIKI